jgi:thiamine biosynthesis lipoprotein
MSATGVTLSARSAWSRIGVGSPAIAVADRDALGTTARLVVWPPENLPGLLAVVDRELALLDQQASRFRQDSEISALHEAGAGSYLISDGLAEAIGIALAAARWTGGLADPTIGSALISLGYDRDFAAIELDATAGPPRAQHRAPGWAAVRLSGHRLTVPAGVRLDLGATAKGLGADRAARAAYAAAGEGGVLGSLGGSPSPGGRQQMAGRSDRGRASPDPGGKERPGRTPAPGPGQRARVIQPPAEADPATAQQVRLGRGGLATSSVTCRQWLRAGQVMHHIIDPRTGLPAEGPWRTVSVAAASCAEANAASTAAIIAGDDAPDWLAAQGLPARLVGHDGRVVLTRGWPVADGGRVNPPVISRLAAYRELDIL